MKIDVKSVESSSVLIFLQNHKFQKVSGKKIPLHKNLFTYGEGKFDIEFTANSRYCL